MTTVADLFIELEKHKISLNRMEQISGITERTLRRWRSRETQPTSRDLICAFYALDRILEYQK